MAGRHHRAPRRQGQRSTLRRDRGRVLEPDRGVAVDERTTAHLVVAALEMAVVRLGNNGATESLFALLQKNVLDRPHRWATRDDLRIEIVTWIERTYHHRRRQARLGRLTPIEYETIMTPKTATAA